MKVVAILSILPIVALCSSAFIYPFENEVSSPLEQLTQHQVTQLIKYNLGLLEHSLPEQHQTFQEMIT